MDVLRSCYSTKMRFAPGGPQVSVDWYFCPTGAKRFSARHSFASLNFWKGDWPSSDTSIGEVVGASRPWRNGSLPAGYDGQRFAGTSSWFSDGCSGHPDLAWDGTPAMPSACAFTPTPPCFSGGMPTYNQVQWRIGSSGAFTDALFISADDWDTTGLVLAGGSYVFEWKCGLSPTTEYLHVYYIPPIGPVQGADYRPSAYDGTLNIWSYNVMHPPGPWTGGTVQAHAFLTPRLRQWKLVTGANAASLTATFPSPTIAGNTIVLAFFQNGTDVSGGTLVNPTFPAGYAVDFSATAKRSYLGHLVNAASVSAVTVSGVSSADLQQFYAAEFFAGTTATIRGSVFKQAQTASTSLSSGLIGDGGVRTAFAVFAVQTRDAPTLLAAPTFTAVGSPFLLKNSGRQTAVGGTPVFESMTSGFYGYDEMSTGGATCTITSDKSQGWDLLAVALG